MLRPCDLSIKMKFYKREAYIVLGAAECYKPGDITVIPIISFISTDYNII